MNHCTKCGAPLVPEAQFCARCGTPVAVLPPDAAPAEPAVPVVPPPVIPPPVEAPPIEAAPASAPPPGNAQSRPTRHVTMPPREMPSAAAAGTPPVVKTKRSTWWIVPLVIVGIVVLAVLLLAGLPFGRDDEATTTRPAVDTIAEGTAPPGTQQDSGTLLELPGDEPIGTQTIAQPPLAGDTTGSIAVGMPPATTNTQPMPPQQQPRVVEEAPRQMPAPRTIPVPAPRQNTPAPAPRQTPAPQPRENTPAPAPRPSAQPAGEISDAEAANTLRGYITSRNYYNGVTSNCVEIRSMGYRNVGYGFAVWDACVSGGGSRLLGRWRVDSKTREVFRQQEDGRFLRP